MAEINKINIKGVDYDIGGGGGSNVLEIDLTPYKEQIGDEILLFLATGLYTNEVSVEQNISFIPNETYFESEDIYNNLLSGNYDTIRFSVNHVIGNESMLLKSPLYTLNGVQSLFGAVASVMYTKPTMFYIMDNNTAIKADISIMAMLGAGNENTIIITTLIEVLKNNQ